MTALVPAGFASGVDASTFGEYRPPATSPRRIDARLGSDGFAAEAGRYHLYGGWFCPRSHRATIVLALRGLTASVGVSYVHGMRDARGWAFRAPTGPDAVNGCTLLRDVYRLGAPDYRGPASVPVLWDTRTRRIVSNDPDTIDVDLATAFAGHGPVLWPEALRVELEAASRRIATLTQTITRAVYLTAAKDDLRRRLRELDAHLDRHDHLVGRSLTLADVRLWTALVRYDVGPNATGAAGPRLRAFASVERWVRDLYAQPAFRDTTDFASFSTPLTEPPAWAS